MNISFTISSANYLPFAKSTGESLLKHNPEHSFIIVLLDQYPEIDANDFLPLKLIHVQDLGIEGFDEMAERYSIFELSCAIKSFASERLFAMNPQAENIFYFDSDMLIYNKLSTAEKMLEDHSILLTPHLVSSKDFAGRVVIEKMLLFAGLYNAGFFALKRSDETFSFLKWWTERMQTLCVVDTVAGLFVDQVWMNFVPLMFPKVRIIDDAGYNFACWNFGERKLSGEAGKYLVNGVPLVFMHYSGYNVNEESVLSKYFPQYDFENTPEVLPLFKDYKEAAIKNNVPDYFSYQPKLGKFPVIITETEYIVPVPVREKFFRRKYNKIFGKKS